MHTTAPIAASGQPLRFGWCLDPLEQQTITDCEQRRPEENADETKRDRATQHTGPQ